MKSFNIIVAIDSAGGIGKDGDLPWKLPADLKYFKEITTTNPDNKPNVVIMGRKTWDSIPDQFKPLPGRINVVLTRNPQISFPKGVHSVPSVQEVQAFLEQNEGWGEVFVIGGQQIFEAVLSSNQCQKLYITHILQEFGCDTFFGPIPDSFNMTQKSEELAENRISFYFSVYQRL